MTPKSDNDVHEMKVSLRSKLKGLFRKPFAKPQKIRKTDCDLTFDALPDFPKQSTKGDHEPEPIDDINPEYLENDENITTEIKENTDSKEYRDDSFSKDNDRKRKGFQTDSKENPPILSQTSVVVNGGVGIHIGNVFNNVNNLYYNGLASTTENIQKVEKTESIKSLLKCEDKIEAGHLQLLSSHFGDKWQEIGVSLGLTTGELDCVRSQKKNLQERAFQMLMLWTQKTGVNAKVGELCKLLWRGKVGTAREAVRQLSLNIHLFE